MSSVTMADLLRHLGSRRRRHLQPLQLHAPRASARRRGPEVQAADRRARSGYKTDWNNFAPISASRGGPNVQDGFLRTLLGDPDQATLRGGYTLAYERQGMAVFTGVFGANPGSTSA